jgi:hypothetical protein
MKHGDAPPLPLFAGEGAEQSEAGGGSLRESHRRESPHPNPPPQARERGRIARGSGFMTSPRKHRVRVTTTTMVVSRSAGAASG